MSSNPGIGQIRRTVKACVSLFKIRVAEHLQYRASAIASTSIGVFWGLLQIVMYTVFFTYGNTDNLPMTLSQAVSYAWLIQILLGLISGNDVEAEIREKIISGDVALELCRPLDLYALWFAKTAASRVGRSAWRMGFTLVIALIMPVMLRLSLPDSMIGFTFFLLSVCSAFMLNVAFSMVLTAVRLGLTWGEGPTQALSLLAIILGGAILPLQLWPDSIQRLLLFQPFAGMLDIPLRLYIGTMPQEDAIWAIGLQLIWMVIFIALGRGLMQRKLSQLIVQGG